MLLTPVFHNFFFLPVALPTLTMSREGTPHHFALWKGDIKQYMATKNADPVCKPLQAFVNKYLRKILGIWLPNIMSNEEVWRRTNHEPIHIIIKRIK
jgi:ribosomal protein L31E